MRIVVLVWDFFGGGAERVAVTLANAFKGLGHEVTLVACRDEGPNRALVRPDVRVAVPPSPGPADVLRFLRGVVAAERPDVLLSHQTTRNVLAILAHLATVGRRGRRVVGVEHGEMNHTALQTRGAGLKLFFRLARVLYPLASGIVAVSDNVGASVRAHLRPLPIRPRTLPNPVVFPGLFERAAEPPGHPFLRDKQGPVLVAVGRLEEQKNYALLLKSFALLRGRVEARLVIFGDGGLRAALEAERDALGLAGAVDLPGFTDNPYAAMRAADALVLSSNWEGLPTVAIEALACGTQVVSTRNSEGIVDILRDGELGWITPHEIPALAAGMEAALRTPKDPDALRARAMAYEAGAVAGTYLTYFETLRGAKPHVRRGGSERKGEPCPR